MAGQSWATRHPGLVRWAAILLPFVVAGRLVLLAFQLHSEHEGRRHTYDPPAWPPYAGEALRFWTGAPYARGWDAPPFTVEVSRRNFVEQEPGTGCLLYPPAMIHGGNLTLVAREEDGRWHADWDGGATIPGFDKGAPLPPGLDEVRAAALHAAEDCGEGSQLKLTDDEVHALVNFVAGQPLPATDPAVPRRVLTIRVNAPPPG